MLEHRLDERDLRRGRRGKANSRRFTPAVCHHHDLCSLSAFGFANVGAPFFAGKNVPSRKVSRQEQNACFVELPEKLAPEVEPDAGARPSWKASASACGWIFDHCSSVSSGAWRLIERLPSISLVVASRCRAQIEITPGFEAVSNASSCCAERTRCSVLLGAVVLPRFHR